MVILKPEMVPVKIYREGNEYRVHEPFAPRFRKSVTVINKSDNYNPLDNYYKLNNYSLKVWELGKGEYIESLGKISKEEAHQEARSRLGGLIQDSSKAPRHPWLKGL